jgi:hypothetical protein
MPSRQVREDHVCPAVIAGGSDEIVREPVTEAPVEIAALVREVSTVGKLVE